ncbi:type II secretion system F family protein [Vibrio metschnikovii]|uniref:type II secretion system F family protein n=1 Tax=Vibrio metschnikovii TaxID=28172 RepID=UPI002FC68CBE
MKQYRYVVRLPNGQLNDGWLTAANEQQARRQLNQQPQQIILLKAQSARRAKPVSREVLITTLRELATLRDSGMPLDLCIASLLETAGDAQMQQGLQRIQQELESGHSLSQAIANQPEVFPFYVSSMLRLGEANGNLGDALLSIAERVEREENLMSEVKSALTYPAFLLVVCVLVLFFMFVYVIPNFEVMVQGGNQTGALATLLGISEFINRNLMWLLGGMVALSAGTYYGFRHGNLTAQLINAACLIPMFRELMQAWNIVQFSGSMQKLLQSGVELVESLEITLNSLADDHLRRTLNKVVIKVREGEGLAEALNQYQLFPLMVIRLIKTGEAGASLVPCFREIHTLFERRLSKGLKRLLTILEPLVIVIMGGIVGSIMIVLISGIISVNDINF